MKKMRIYALIGPSGTGKSHRASMVAMEKNVEAIIDDGLLIIDGRIVAGYSAKRESTRVAAVKRAVFLDPGHAFAVREAMDNLKPDSGPPDCERPAFGLQCHHVDLHRNRFL